MLPEMKLLVLFGPRSVAIFAICVFVELSVLFAWHVIAILRCGIIVESVNSLQISY